MAPVNTSDPASASTPIPTTTTGLAENQRPATAGETSQEHGTSSNGLQDAALDLEKWAGDDPVAGSSRVTRKRGSDAVAINYKEAPAPSRFGKRPRRSGNTTKPLAIDNDEWTGLPAASKFKALPHTNLTLNTKHADAEMQIWDIKEEFPPVTFDPIWKDRIHLSLPTYELYSAGDISPPRLVRVTRVFECPSQIGSEDYNVMMKVTRLALANRAFQSEVDPDFEIHDNSPVSTSVRVLPQNHGMSDDQLRNIFRTHNILEVGDSSGEHLGPETVYSFVHRDLRTPCHVHSMF